MMGRACPVNEVQRCLECGESVLLGDACDRQICAQRPHRVLEVGPAMATEFYLCAERDLERAFRGFEDLP